MSDMQPTEAEREEAEFHKWWDSYSYLSRRNAEITYVCVKQAVKAERERCLGKAKKLIVSVNRNDKIAAVVNASCNATTEALIKLILSDDQEARNG